MKSFRAMNTINSELFRKNRLNPSNKFENVLQIDYIFKSNALDSEIILQKCYFYRYFNQCFVKSITNAINLI